MGTSTGGIARVDHIRSHAKTPHDNLLLPDGRKVGTVKDITPVLVKLGIPGASHDNGRLANIEAYAAELARVGEEGYRLAVARWLAERERQS